MIKLYAKSSEYLFFLTLFSLLSFLLSHFSYFAPCIFFLYFMPFSTVVVSFSRTILPLQVFEQYNSCFVRNSKLQREITAKLVAVEWRQMYKGIFFVSPVFSSISAPIFLFSSFSFVENFRFFDN